MYGSNHLKSSTECCSSVSFQGPTKLNLYGRFSRWSIVWQGSHSGKILFGWGWCQQKYAQQGHLLHARVKTNQRALTGDESGLENLRAPPEDPAASHRLHEHPDPRLLVSSSCAAWRTIKIATPTTPITTPLFSDKDQQILARVRFCSSSWGSPAGKKTKLTRWVSPSLEFLAETSTRLGSSWPAVGSGPGSLRSADKTNRTPSMLASAGKNLRVSFYFEHPFWSTFVPYHPCEKWNFVWLALWCSPARWGTPGPWSQRKSSGHRARHRQKSLSRAKKRANGDLFV